jgi:hypothetical protein
VFRSITLGIKKNTEKKKKCMTQAAELSENSLISETFLSTAEKVGQIFLLNACFQRCFHHLIGLSEFFSTLC